ncbi:MAG: class I SAM-dependent methyltransferase [Candidatus Omnitrophota bacterium]|jgi:ubiquinone/menaquinone biosynthesis C-methylase UbiE
MRLKLLRIIEEKIYYEYLAWLYQLIIKKCAAPCVGRRILLSDFSSVGEKSVLDVGSGGGIFLIDMKKMNGEGLFAVGLDISSPLLKLSRREALKNNINKGIHFIGGDAHSLPFADQSFDLAVINGALHHFDRPTVVFNEIHRILKSSGKAYIYEHMRVKNIADLKDLFLRHRIPGIGLTALTVNEIENSIKSSQFSEYSISRDNLLVRIQMQKSFG